MTLVMSWFMVILMAGSVIYAAISALGGYNKDVNSV